MIRVTLEATTLDAASLGIETVETIEIRDYSRGPSEHGDYVWAVKNTSGEVRADGRLLDYPRSQGSWALVWAVLGQVCKAVDEDRQGGGCRV